MSEQMVARARQNCCRLCLAPDNECISIYGNLLAADKETISSKIHACVNIKVTKDDSLSTQICHICISYLNCWQSFKNRCVTAQKRQEEWLTGENVTLEKEYNNLRDFHYNDSYSNGINLSTNKKLKHIPIQIKEEPVDDLEELKTDEDDAARCDIDPTQFLDTNVIEDEELKRLVANKNLTITKSGGENGPQILTSLGLQSIGSENVNPFAFLSASLGASNDNLNEISSDTNNKSSITPGAPSQKPHDCRICKMKFSTRANARRHERNLHGLINDMAMSPLTVSSNQNTIPGQSSTSTPKNSRQKANMAPMTPEMMGIYEYDKPEKYRHMLTAQKLEFIEEFEEFLKQYQTLTCKCCSKVYPKYKNFMAHMRKKYPKLPRASCFKCLKQFESKAIFVSHVKRRNCINLYKLYLNDPTFEKYDKVDKIKAKELLSNKLYECRLCPKEFRLKLDFRNHVHEDHNEMMQKKETSPDACVFCNLKIDDSVERKRHYNNMECIVHIRCSTCNTKFETHQSFLEHVYKDHVPSQSNNSRDSRPSNLLSDFNSLNDFEDSLGGSPQKTGNTNNDSTASRDIESVPPVKTQFHSRMPQNCKICGARYNNYNNVLRHMEAKHPDQLPQTYKCSLCYVGFPRLSNLREHMWDVHNKKLAKPKRDAEIYCRICLEKFLDKDSWVNHQTEQHDRYICCICFSQYDDLSVFKEHIKIHTSLSYPRQPNPIQNISNASNDSSKYTGRYDYVMKDLMSITNGSNNNNDDKDGVHTDGPPNKKIKLNDDSNLKLDIPQNMEMDDSNSQQQSNNTISNSNNEQKAITKQSTNLHECHICHSAFNSSQGLSNHMRAHNAQEIARRASLGLPPLQSKSQSKQNDDSAEGQNKFSKNNQVLALEHRFRRMRCRLCQKRFSSKKVYRRHMLEDHHVQNVQFIHCAICRAEFAHEKGLKVHMIKIHGEILRDIGIENLQYECDICSIVYKSEEELMSHKQSVHNLAINLSGNESTTTNSNNNKRNNDDSNLNNGGSKTNSENQYWFQCRYCSSNFDSNKKLAIHINIHDEFDSSDYSCKDCGNVYSGRKSLWVHRYKKHPVLPSPSFCDMCNKMFFTREHLEFHMQHLHKISSTNSISDQNNTNDGTNSDNKTTKENINSQEEDNHKKILHVSGEDVQTVKIPKSYVPQIPQVPCSVCQMKFSDEEAFTKHMKIHEESFYTDNPLAAMFDTEPEDPDTALQKRINENGEFVCDICPKTFQQLTALKVHRNWHFKSDTKQGSADASAWRSLGKKEKRSSSFKCQQCSSTFSSSSNLKRHVLEVHKENSNSTTVIELEKPLNCKKCNLQFETNVEWVEHKIAEVKQTFHNTYEWGCEICGKILSRKDRLIQHMHSHSREIELKTVNQDKNLPNIDNNGENKSDLSDNNSRDLPPSYHDKENEQSSIDNNKNEEQIAETLKNSPNTAEEKESNSNDSDSDSDSNSDSDSDSDSDENNERSENEKDTDEDEEDNNEENDDEDMNDASGPHSCDLCQITFDTEQQLIKHVPTHLFHQTPEPIKPKSSKKDDSDTNNKEIPKDNDNNELISQDNVGIKLEKNNSVKNNSQNNEKESVNETQSETQIKKEYIENERTKEKTVSPIIIKREFQSENINDEENKQSELFSFHSKDFVIKQEKSDVNENRRNSRHSRDTIHEIISDIDSDDSDDNIENDDDDDEDDYHYNENNHKNQEHHENNHEDDEYTLDNEYVTSAQPITIDLPENSKYDSDSEDDIDDDDDDEEDDDDDEDEDDNENEHGTIVRPPVNEEVIGEEIVHDDNAEYHENNIVDLNAFADTEYVPPALDGDDEHEEGEDDENYEHFMDDEHSMEHSEEGDG